MSKDSTDTRQEELLTQKSCKQLTRTPGSKLSGIGYYQQLCHCSSKNTLSIQRSYVPLQHQYATNDSFDIEGIETGLTAHMT